MANRVRNGWTEELGKGKLGREMYGEGKALGDFYISRESGGTCGCPTLRKDLKPQAFTSG